LLSKNRGAIKLLRKQPNKICWSNMSFNPAATELFKENIDKLNWVLIAANPHAIEILENNVDKIKQFTTISVNGILPRDVFELQFCECIMSNPAIFEYDYVTMKKTMADFKEELMAAAWHPSRVVKWIETGDEWFVEE
jgi:hypothetical protein